MRKRVALAQLRARARALPLAVTAPVLAMRLLALTRLPLVVRQAVALRLARPQKHRPAT